MSKTPYELRLDLLNLSAAILGEQARVYNNTQQTIVSNLSQKKDVDQKILNRFLEDWDITKSAPTTEDIIAEAEKLNVFLSGVTVGKSVSPADLI